MSLRWRNVNISGAHQLAPQPPLQSNNFGVANFSRTNKAQAKANILRTLRRRSNAASRHFAVSTTATRSHTSHTRGRTRFPRSCSENDEYFAGARSRCIAVRARPTNAWRVGVARHTKLQTTSPIANRTTAHRALLAARSYADHVVYASIQPDCRAPVAGADNNGIKHTKALSVLQTWRTAPRQLRKTSTRTHAAQRVATTVANHATKERPNVARSARPIPPARLNIVAPDGRSVGRTPR